jgi:hypothetical protein
MDGWGSAISRPRRRALLISSDDQSVSAVNLEKLIQQRPNLSKRVATLLKSGKRVDAILAELRNSGLAGRYYVEFVRNDEWAAEEWSDDEAALRSRINSDLQVGIYKSANLWYLDPKTKEWSIMGRFPSAAENSN